ncbi:MAG: hypothetical protein KDC54_07190 [Lewinella sp.]|nr:hypothetical protein [Lewinella sp.]
MTTFNLRFILLLLLTTSLSCRQSTETTDAESSPGPAKVELKNESGHYQLYVDGEPFYIEGAGLEFGNIEALAAHGANSFRTWRTDNGQSTGREVLDEAYENGLYVTMGIEVARERHGFDYDDEAAVAEQFERIKQEVLALKDHPALLIWAIGNELNLRATNPKVWDAVNQISEFIHEVDPNHLTTTTLAGIGPELVSDIKVHAPDLDLLSVQMYADIVNLPRKIEEAGWEKAYMVTEWGATGHWEVGTTAWEAPIENNSSQKADYYLERYRTAIEPYGDQCVGSYVFLWGQKQERTPTWYGIFLEDGEETESVDVMHFIWNDAWPANRTPRLEDFQIDGRVATDNITLAPGAKVPAFVQSTDPEGDSLTYHWEIMEESTDLGDGGDLESVPPVLDNLVEGGGAEVTMKAPDQPGAYRLFVYVMDGNNHAAHANIPFLVEK